MNMKGMILEILKANSGGCKEIELIADLTIQLFAEGLMAGNGEPFDTVAFDKAMVGLIMKDKIRVVEYRDDLADDNFKMKRFIHLL